MKHGWKEIGKVMLIFVKRKRRRSKSSERGRKER